MNTFVPILHLSHRRLRFAGLACVLVSVCAAKADTASGDVASARQMLEQGRVEEARELLAALPQAGKDAEVQRLLGEISYRQQRWADAREHLREALRIDPIADDHVRLGEVYILERKFALALAQFRSALRLGVLDGELHYRLAMAYAGLGRVLGDVQRVSAPGGRVGTRVDEVLLVEELADAPGVFWAASSDSAVYHVARARALGADTLEVRLLDARLWLEGRQYAEALGRYLALEEALEKSELPDAQRSAALSDFAEACFRSDDFDGYLSRLHAAHRGDRASLSAAMAQAHRRVSDRYAARGDLLSCITHLEKAVSETPRSTELRFLLGNRYWEAGESLRAAREWRILLQLEPAHAARAQILDRLQFVAAEYGTR